MSGQIARRYGLRLIALPIAAMAAYGLASGEKRDPIIQSRVYDHADRMESAYAVGNEAEALACAEMILLRRDLTVYVDDRNVPAQIKDDASKAIRNAAINWEDSLGREIRIRFVPRSVADVIVKYAGDMRYGGKEAAGTVRWSRGVMDLGAGQYQYKVTASITLRTYTPSGREMNYGQMLHTAGHELGHVMGLEDTGKSGDLMGPLRLSRPVERATRHEIQSLNEVRQRATIVLNHITGVDLFSKVYVDESHSQVLATKTKMPEAIVTFRVQESTPKRVLSIPTRSIESKKTTLRVVADKRGANPVRRTRRNRKAPRRTKKFAIGGMAW